jgi:hypothetical protein
MPLADAGSTYTFAKIVFDKSTELELFSHARRVIWQAEITERLCGGRREVPRALASFVAGDRTL